MAIPDGVSASRSARVDHDTALEVLLVRVE